MYYIGVDIGGTNIAVGILDERKSLLYKLSCKTNIPRPGEEICYDIKNLIKKILQETNVNLLNVHSIGVGCPGAINSDNGILEYSANLSLQNFNIVSVLEKIIGKRVFVNNDANLAALGEYLVGSAKGSNTSITLTIGTGIGTGIIIDGKIYTGFNHMAGESGHMVIQKEGRRCACSRCGCFETYASARGLVRTTKEILSQYSFSESIMWEMIDNNLDKISGRTAFQAMKQGDDVAKQIINRYVNDLACGIINLINIIQPEILCIGGGISNEGEFLLKPLRQIINNETYNHHSKSQTQILKAQLGNNAGIIGAALQGV